jgi:putative peptidoglycan lipid II flippase
LLAALRAQLGPLWAAAATVASLTLAGKVLGLVKEMVIAAQFGAGPSMDAFLLALSLPTFAINVVAGMLPMALTPAFVAARERHGANAARVLAGTAFRHTYAVMTALAVLLAAATVLVGAMPRSGLSAEARAMLPVISLLLVPFTMLQGAAAAWTGLLAAEGAFAIGALAPMCVPVVMVMTVLASAHTIGIASVAVGLGIGSALQLLVLARAMRTRSLPLWAHGASLQAVYAQYLPAVGGALLTSGCGLADQIMASWLPSGSVAAIGYGGKLVSVGMSLAIVAIGTPLLPHLSTLAERGDWLALRTFQRRSTVSVLAFTIPIAAIIALASEPLVRLAFQRGAFTAHDTDIVSRVQALYVLQLPGHFLAVLYARAIAAMRATWWLTAGAAVSLLVNLVANVGFMRVLGAPGIALSTSLVHTLSAVMLFVVSDRLLRDRVLATRDVPLTRVAPADAVPTAPAPTGATTTPFDREVAA